MSDSMQMSLGLVVALWRYPVKSMQGDELNAAAMTERGLIGDRTNALLDCSDGKVASAKDPRKWPQLFDYRAACVDPPQADADLPKDPGILRTAAEHNLVNVGVYASVVRGGTVRRGDATRLEEDCAQWVWHPARLTSVRNYTGRARHPHHVLRQRRPRMQAQDKTALYDRLGGVYAIATVVDDFIDRVMSDPRLNANPRVDEAHHRVAPAGFKYLVTEMLCWAAGGPQQYSGRPMGEMHRDLLITEQEWQAFMDDLQQTFDRFGVPQPEQDEVRAIVESTREAIVMSPLQEASEAGFGA